MKTTLAAIFAVVIGMAFAGSTYAQEPAPSGPSKGPMLQDGEMKQEREKMKEERKQHREQKKEERAEKKRKRQEMKEGTGKP